MSFPLSPTNGQLATVDGVVYTYATPPGVWNVGVVNTSNISGAALAVSGAATVGGTLGVTGATNLSSTLVVSGNVTGGNILTSGPAGNITGANVIIATTLSATGNIVGGNLNITGNIVDSGSLSIITSANGNISLSPNGTGLVTSSANVVVTGFVNPAAGNTYDLGTTTLRWRNIYTNDLQLSNGIGDYTVVEGEEDLFLYNNKSGKTFKFALIEVDPSTVPPKAQTGSN